MSIVKGLGIACLIFLPSLVLGQRLISSKKIKKFPTNDPVFYPYTTPSIGSEEVYIIHDPAIRLSDGSFVHIWEKSWSKKGYRELTHYDLFLEEISSGELQLEREEDVIHTIPEDTILNIYTYEYDYSDQRHHVRHRRVGVAGTEILESKSIWLSNGRFGEQVTARFSPDKKLMLLSQPLGYRKGSKSYYIEDVIFNYQDVQPRHTRTGGINFMVFDLQKNKVLHADSILWKDKKKWISTGTGVDNQGNVYAGIYDRKNKFIAYEWHASDEKQQQMAYDELPSYRDFLDVYSGFIGLKVGKDRKAYISQTKRVKNGKLRGTKNFQVICFDFKTGELDLKRDVEISSGLKVQIGKVREEFGLKANKRFENYLITDFMELEDESILLITQKYGLNTSNAVAIDFPRRGKYEEYAEELVLFEFDPEGNIQKALVVPSYQRSTDVLDRMGFFYDIQVNEASKQIDLITREASGKKLRGPDRLFLRKIDMEKGLVTDRKLIYKGERRDQFFLKAFSQWLNEDLISFIVLEGVRGQAYLVTVNIAQEPEEEEK